MIRIKPEPVTKKGKIGVTHAPYALTRKVIPEVMFDGKRLNGKKNWLPYNPKIAQPFTKSAKKAVKNTPRKGGDGLIAQMKAFEPAPDGEQRGAGRPKVHESGADRQRAYRERKKGQTR